MLCTLVIAMFINIRQVILAFMSDHIAITSLLDLLLQRSGMHAAHMLQMSLTLCVHSVNASIVGHVRHYAYSTLSHINVRLLGVLWESQGRRRPLPGVSRGGCYFLLAWVF